jgi:hypothetical protein
MKTLSKHLKQALAALAAADAGEMLTPRQKDRYLHAPEGAGRHRRQVALWGDGVPGEEALDYALAACRRLDADLLFLHGEDTDTSWIHERLRNLPVETTPLRGRTVQALREYLANHPQVAFLVLDGADTASQTLALRSGNLGVPVVLVTGNRGTRPMPRAMPRTPAPGSSAQGVAPLAALG